MFETATIVECALVSRIESFGIGRAKCRKSEGKYLSLCDEHGTFSSMKQKDF